MQAHKQNQNILSNPVMSEQESHFQEYFLKWITHSRIAAGISMKFQMILVIRERYLYQMAHQNEELVK